MSKNYDGWENALTVLQEARPPFIPEGVHAMTVVVDYPPGSAGSPPHRHSGPAFGYMLEGEMLFELEGEPPRVIRAGEAFWEPGGDVIHYSNANNRDDMRCRYTVTMLGAPGQPHADPRRRRGTGSAQAPACAGRVQCAEILCEGMSSDVENLATNDNPLAFRRLGHQPLFAVSRRTKVSRPRSDCAKPHEPRRRRPSTESYRRAQHRPAVADGHPEVP